MNIQYIIIFTSLLYFLLTWYIFGKDVKIKDLNTINKDSKFNFTPAFAEYLKTQFVNPKILFFTILNLAYKKALIITDNQKESWKDSYVYILRKSNTLPDGLEEEEQTVLNNLFSSRNEIIFNRLNARTLFLQQYAFIENIYKKKYPLKKYVTSNWLLIFTNIVVFIASIYLLKFVGMKFELWLYYFLFIFLVIPLLIGEYIWGTLKTKKGLVGLIFIFPLWTFVTFVAFQGYRAIFLNLNAFDSLLMTILTLGFYFNLRFIKRKTNIGELAQTEINNHRKFLMNYKMSTNNAENQLFYEQNIAFALHFEIEKEWVQKFKPILDSFDNYNTSFQVFGGHTAFAKDNYFKFIKTFEIITKPKNNN
jgi:hypothetical protein